MTYAAANGVAFEGMCLIPVGPDDGAPHDSIIQADSFGNMSAQQDPCCTSGVK